MFEAREPMSADTRDSKFGSGGSVGRGNQFRLNSTTVLDDNAIDMSNGGADADWFWDILARLIRISKLAFQKLTQKKPGQTFQATALVHEAYARLVGGIAERSWDIRGHFLAAAASCCSAFLDQQTDSSPATGDDAVRRPERGLK